MVRPLHIAFVLGCCALSFLAVSAFAKDTGLIFISNEKSNTITILDSNDQIVRSFGTCARPRGMHFSED